MRVLLLSRYGPLGSTSRLRFYQYLPFLRENGLELTVAPLLADPYVERLYAGERQPVGFLLRAYLARLGALASARRYDLVWVEKEFLPWFPAVAPYLLGTPYVADYDDAAFHRYDLHRSAFIRALLGRKIDTVMRRAALVMAGNDYLATRARKAGARRVEILPTVVDTQRYQPRPTAAPQSENQAAPKPFTIGWIGAPVTAPYLRAIEPVLRQLAASGRLRITIVGADPPFDEPIPAESRPWSEAAEVAELQRFDVGIMPLPDEPFERGKCGYKLIQYMGCGLPVVASPVGVNTAIVEHGVNGFLANSHAEWVRALDTLRADPDLRRRMGAAGREKVAARYSLEVAAPRLLEILRTAAGEA